MSLLLASDVFFAAGVEFLSINDVSKDERRCAIWMEDLLSKEMIPQEPNGEADTHESFLRVNACGNIFGDMCLTKHFRGGRPNSNQSPLCRTQLFTENEMNVRESLDGETENTIEGPDAREELLYEDIWLNSC